jgi:hypothetical protein
VHPWRREIATWGRFLAAERSSLGINGVAGAGPWVLELGGFTMLASLRLQLCNVTDTLVPFHA